MIFLAGSTLVTKCNALKYLSQGAGQQPHTWFIATNITQKARHHATSDTGVSIAITEPPVLAAVQ
jgi:hypothetical protein